jgi:hypothetical protein
MGLTNWLKKLAPLMDPIRRAMPLARMLKGRISTGYATARGFQQILYEEAKKMTQVRIPAPVASDLVLAKTLPVMVQATMPASMHEVATTKRGRRPARLTRLAPVIATIMFQIWRTPLMRVMFSWELIPMDRRTGAM